MSVDSGFKIVVGAGFIIGGIASGNPGLVASGGGMFVSGVSDALGGNNQTGLTQRQAGMLLGNTSQSNIAIPVVYGKAKIGVTVCDYRVDTASEDDKDLYIPAVLCHGARHGIGIAGIDEIYFNDQLAWAATEQIQPPYTEVNAYVTKILGKDTENWADETIAGTDLGTVTADWDKTAPGDEGQGLAGLLFKLVYNRDVYPGIPTITAIVRGNHVEDPRSEVSGINITFADADPDTITRASGSFVTDGWIAGDIVQVTGSTSNDGYYRINTVAALVLTLEAAESLTAEGASSTETLKRWARPDNGGDNPALCIRDYLLSTIYGPGITSTEIDETSFAAMATYYETAGYTCNGWIDTAKTVRANLEELLTSCRGNLIYEGGVYRLFTTRAVTPSTITLSRDNIVGDWNFSNAGASDKINIIRGTFVNPTRDYKPDQVQHPDPNGANAYLTADNEFENRSEIDMPFTNSYAVAEKIICLQLQESRQGIVAEVTCTEEALQLQIGDVVPVTHETPGWTAKSFWVMGMWILPNTQIRLLLAEYDSSAYSLPGMQSEPAEPDTDLPSPFEVIEATGLTLTAQYRQIGAQVAIPEILVEWTDAVDTFVDHYEIQLGRLLPALSQNLSYHNGNSTITRAAGSWYDDGYRPGEKIYVGAAADANNNGLYTITSIDSATIITVSPAPGTTTAADASTLRQVTPYQVMGRVEPGIEQFLISPIEMRTESETWMVRLVTVNVLGIRSVSATNICPYSDDISSWTNVGCIVTGGQADPDAGTNAYLVLDNSAAAEEYVEIGTATTKDLQYKFQAVRNGDRTIALAVKAGTGVQSRFVIYDASNTANLAVVSLTWSAGNPVLAVVSGTVTLRGFVDLGSSWFLVQFIVHDITLGHINYLRIYPASDGTVTPTGSLYIYRITLPDGDRKVTNLVLSSGGPNNAVTFVNGITNIDNGDSPYDVEPKDTFVQADCTAGNITINLPKTTLFPGRVIAFRCINPTLGTVTLTAAAGDTSEITNIGADTLTHQLISEPSALYWREIANNN